VKKLVFLSDGMAAALCVISSSEAPFSECVVLSAGHGPSSAIDR
jgi:hypothetical protein